MNKNNNKLSKKIIILIIILIIAVLGMGSYLLYDKVLKNNPNFITKIINDKEIKKLEEGNKKLLTSYNEYSKKRDYLFVDRTTEPTPHNYQDILNLLYTLMNNKISNYEFICPKEYENCIDDISKISKNSELLSDINNFVHPYNSYSKIGIVSNSEDKKVEINITYLYSEETINKIENKVNEIIKENINNEMTIEEKVKATHDYIINNTTYDITTDNDLKYNAEGPLFYGIAASNGYADLFSIIISKFNIDNFKVVSPTHMWNAIEINNEWKHIDLSWDDPIDVEYPNINNLIYDYYLLNSIDLLLKEKKEHSFDVKVYQELNYSTDMEELDFPKNNENVILEGLIQDIIYYDENTYYKTIEYDKYNIKLKLECSDGCDGHISHNLTINNKITLKNIEISDIYLLATEQYIIIQNSHGYLSTGELYIFDYYGNKLKTIEETASEYLIINSIDKINNGDDTKNSRIKINDNKLYYLKETGYGLAEFRYIDLKNNLEDNLIEKINAFTNQEQ